MEVHVTADEHRTEVMKDVTSVTLKRNKDMTEMKVYSGTERVCYTYCQVPESVLITHGSCFSEEKLKEEKNT